MGDLPRRVDVNMDEHVHVSRLYFLSTVRPSGINAEWQPALLHNLAQNKSTESPSSYVWDLRDTKIAAMGISMARYFHLSAGDVPLDSSLIFFWLCRFLFLSFLVPPFLRCRDVPLLFSPMATRSTAVQYRFPEFSLSSLSLVQSLSQETTTTLTLGVSWSCFG